jgi:hypothetical protein
MPPFTNSLSVMFPFLSKRSALIQGSRLEKSPIKQINNPNEHAPTKKNPIFSILIEYWWQLLIGLISGILLILIERGIIDIGL